MFNTCEIVSGYLSMKCKTTAAVGPPFAGAGLTTPIPVFHQWNGNLLEFYMKDVMAALLRPGCRGLNLAATPLTPIFPPSLHDIRPARQQGLTSELQEDSSMARS